VSGNDHPHDHRPDDPVPAVDVWFSEEFWDGRYRSSEPVWSGDPNLQLVTAATGRRPGRALDAGCGEGADAIWLAGRGWNVTAVDISTIAMQRGAAEAAERDEEIAGRITWQHVDLLSWTPPPQSYDLVSAQFMQLPAAARADLHDRLAAGVAPGGTLIVVGHSPRDNSTVHPRLPELFFTADDVAASLDASRWTILVAEVRPRDAPGRDGRTVTVHDEVVVAERN
jgi:SAM-dependent methyltransferase